MSDFKRPAGSFNASHAADRAAKQGGKPSAGITNESRGNQAPAGPGKGTPANGKRIR